MVPRLVAIGPRLVGLVAMLIRLADQDEIDNHTTVMVAFVPNQIPRRKQGWRSVTGAGLVKADHG